MNTEPDTRQSSLFQTSWQRSCALGLTPPADLQQRLLAAYAQPQRHYHTQQHLTECLTHFDAVWQQAQRPGEVAMALWFHDAIYDIKAQDKRAAQRSMGCAGAQELGCDRRNLSACARPHHGHLATLRHLPRHPLKPTPSCWLT